MTTHLPNELLVKIIEDLALSRTDLLHLRAADRKFRALASPHAFRVLHAGYTATSARALENLLNSQAVADYVEEISFEQEERVSQTLFHLIDRRTVSHNHNVWPWKTVWPGTEPDSDPDSDDDDEDMVSAYTNVFSALDRVPNLKSLSFAFHVPTVLRGQREKDVARPYRAFQWMVVKALSRNTLPHPSLTSLRLVNMLPYVHESLYAALSAFIGSLHHLRMSVLTGNSEGVSSRFYHLGLQAYWRTVSTHIFRPAVSLRSLSFGVSDIVASMSAVFNLVHCPHLESISLTNVQFDAHEGSPPRIGTEAFIVRHKDTLTKLELDRCGIQVRGDEETPAQTWADVWGRFARELGGLREITVRFEGDGLSAEGDDLQMGYVFLNERICFAPVDWIVEGKDRDWAALRALEQLVRTRAEGNSGMTPI